MKMLVVVQARTSSTRLFNKIFLPLGGRPLLARMLERLQWANTPFELMVATTWDAVDDSVAQLAHAEGIACLRGHPTDLLDRHLHAARVAGSDVVVKIPSDCPLIDPAVVDCVLSHFLEDPSRYDYVSNLHPATWPDGYDVEVMTREALEIAASEARLPHHREHTTPFLWDQPERFRIGNVAWHRDLSMTHRLTIDYAEDYQLIKAAFEALHAPDRTPFGLSAILDYLDTHPDVFALNQKYAGVNWYRHHLDELKTVDASRTRWPESELQT